MRCDFAPLSFRLPCHSRLRPAVNWSASLRPQHFLREQWAKEHNLPFFLSTDYARSIEAVCERMGVSDEHLEHNKPNRMLVSGSQKLGYPISKIPVRSTTPVLACRPRVFLRRSRC